MFVYVLRYIYTYICVYIPHTQVIGTTWGTSAYSHSVLVTEPSSNVDKARHPDTTSLSTRFACEVNANLPSGCRLSTATSIFQHLNLLSSQSHKLKPRMQLHHGCS